MTRLNVETSMRELTPRQVTRKHGNKTRTRSY